MNISFADLISVVSLFLGWTIGTSLLFYVGSLLWNTFRPRSKEEQEMAIVARIIYRHFQIVAMPVAILAPGDRMMLLIRSTKKIFDADKLQDVLGNEVTVNQSTDGKCLITISRGDASPQLEPA